MVTAAPFEQKRLEILRCLDMMGDALANIATSAVDHAGASIAHRQVALLFLRDFKVRVDRMASALDAANVALTKGDPLA